MKADLYVIRDLDELGFQLYLILLYILLGFKSFSSSA